MVGDFPAFVPEPFQSILSSLQNKIDGLPELYRESIRADVRELSAAVAAWLSPAEAAQSIPTTVEQVLDSLIAGVVVFDQHDVVQLANDYAVSLFGFNPLGMTQDMFLIRLRATGEDGMRIPDAQMPSRRAAQGEVVPNQRLTITVPHGRIYHVLASAMPLFAGDRVSGAVSIWNDVTGLHNLDEDIRQQKELLEVVLNETPYGLAIISGAELRYRYTNRAFRALSEDLAHVDGNPLRSTGRSEETFQRVREAIEQVIATGETARFTQEGIEQPDGSVRYFSSHTTRVTWEKEPAALVMLWDVTEVVQAKTEAQQRAAEFQAIFEAISDPVLVFDAAGMPARTNPASIQAFGFDAAGVRRAEMARRLGLAHPGGALMAEGELVSSRVLAGEQVRDLPMRYRDARGQMCSALGSGLPLVGADGAMNGAVVILHDITRREQQERRMIEDLITQLVGSHGDPSEIIERLDECAAREGSRRAGSRARKSDFPKMRRMGSA